MESTEVEINAGSSRTKFIPRILPPNVSPKLKNVSQLHKVFSLTPKYKYRSASRFSRLVESIPHESKLRKDFENLTAFKNKHARPRKDNKNTPEMRKNTFRAFPARFQDIKTIRSSMLKERPFKFPRASKDDMKLIKDVQKDFESINLYLELNNSKSILKDSFDEKNKTRKVKFIDV